MMAVAALTGHAFARHPSSISRRFRSWSRGLMLADFTAVVATTDFVMADVDK